MIKKTIIDNNGIFSGKRYFDIYITNELDDLNNNDKNTIIYVDDNEYFDKVYESINNELEFSDLVTTGYLALEDKFKNSGNWHFKHFYTKTKEEMIDRLKIINSNNIFLSFWCNFGSDLYEIADIVEVFNNNVLSILPVVSKDKKKKYEISVIYK